MRLENFLLVESEKSGRTKVLTEEEFIKLAKKNCSVAIKNHINRKCTIFRGSNNSDEFMWGNGSNAAQPRRSKNTTNFYTLWMDNHKDWAYYPKRSQSFICSSGMYSTHFGRYRHIVLPYDDIKIGITTSEDIWDSLYINNSTNEDLIEIFKAIYSFVEEADSRFKNADKDWSTLNWCIDTFDSTMINNKLLYDMIIEEKAVPYNSFTNHRHWKGTLRDTLNYMWTPNNNGIMLGSTDDKINDNSECWMEGPVLMISTDYQLHNMKGLT